MDNFESEVNLNEVEEADQLPEGLIEETDETEIDLADAVDSAEEGQAADEQTETEQGTEPQAKEPGYVKGRIEKAVAKVREEYEATIAPLREQLAAMQERMLKADAQELVKKGEFRSVETAEEYLRLKQGLPASTIEEPKDQPRNANGQFAPKQDAAVNAATQARIDMLKHQASQIKARTGVDVIAAFNNDPNIKNRVIAGEIDFYDVAEEIGKQPKKGKPPAPMRSPNGAATSHPNNAIESMTDEQFRRLEERVKKGARIRQS